MILTSLLCAFGLAEEVLARTTIARNRATRLKPEEFVDATIHRLGETRRAPQGSKPRPANRTREFDAMALLVAVEKSCGIARDKFCCPGKGADLINANEALILVGRQAGASVKALADLTGISSSAVSRRYDAARRNLREDEQMTKLAAKVARHY